MTEDPIIETGNVHVIVKEITILKKIKNAQVTLLQNNTERFTGATDYKGEITFEDVPYGTYTLHITRTGYVEYSNNLNVNGASIVPVVFLTHQPVNPDEVEVDMDETYTFNISEQTHPDYRCCASIIQWIKENLEGLTDDYGADIFSKVNYGYNSETLKGFGKRPVADVYINNLEYSTDFDNNKPDMVNSFIICALKGNMNNAYLKACELIDFLIQQFEENNSFRELEDVVRTTSVSNVGIEIIPSNKTYGILCTFELQHELY